ERPDRLGRHDDFDLTRVHVLLSQSCKYPPAPSDFYKHARPKVLIVVTRWSGRAREVREQCSTAGTQDGPPGRTTSNGAKNTPGPGSPATSSRSTATTSSTSSKAANIPSWASAHCVARPCTPSGATT